MLIRKFAVTPFLQDTQRLTPMEKKDLLSFLRMLTDSSFITDPKFSNPFK